MSEQRRNKNVDWLWNEWHRPGRDKMWRFLEKKQAWELGMIDIDCCEWCRYCRQPLALIEAKVWGADRNFEVTENLARMAQIPAYCVEYRPTDGDVWNGQDIAEFRVTSSTSQAIYTPDGMANFLYDMRREHHCGEATAQRYARSGRPS